MRLRARLRRTLSGWIGLARRRPDRGRLLMYHEIAEGHDPSQYVPPALFRRQLDEVATLGLAVRTVHALMSRGFPTAEIALSFDDGYRSAAAAAEAMLSRGWPATLFIVPDWVGVRPGVVGWPDLVALANAGVEIGAHGSDHSAPCGKRVEDLTADLLRARESIEQRLGRRVWGLAYPFGLAPVAAREAARRAGFAYACTTEPGSNDVGTDPFRLRRNEILGTDVGRHDLRARLAGSDDWMLPIRRFENMLRCRGGAIAT